MGTLLLDPHVDNEKRNEHCVQVFTPRPYVYWVQFHPGETPESALRYLLEKSKFTEMAHLFPRPKEYVKWRILKNFVAIVEKKEGAKVFKKT